MNVTQTKVARSQMVLDKVVTITVRKLDNMVESGNVTWSVVIIVTTEPMLFTDDVHCVAKVKPTGQVVCECVYGSNSGHAKYLAYKAAVFLGRQVHLIMKSNLGGTHFMLTLEKLFDETISECLQQFQGTN